MLTLGEEVQSLINRINEPWGDDREVGRTRFRDLYKETWRLAEIVRSGGTTGDPIRDLLMVSGVLYFAPLPNEKTEQKYRNLEGKLKTHIGEFVLVVVIREHSHHTGISSRSEAEYFMREEFCLGVIQRGELAIDPSEVKCEIVTEKNVTFTRPESESTVVQGNVRIAPRDIDFLDVSFNSLYPHVRRRDDSDAVLSIKVGDEEVIKYFESKMVKFYDTAYREAARLLGRSISGP